MFGGGGGGIFGGGAAPAAGGGGGLFGATQTPAQPTQSASLFGQTPAPNQGGGIQHLIQFLH